MTLFDTAVAFTIEQETGGDPDGAYHTDPYDPGGATKWGIAQRYHPTINIRDLDRAAAVVIYQREYWTSLGCDTLTPALAVAAFECGVNPGTSWATTALHAVIGRPRPAWRLLVARGLYWSSRPTFAAHGDFPGYGKDWLGRLLDTYKLCLQVADWGH